MSERISLAELRVYAQSRKDGEFLAAMASVNADWLLALIEAVEAAHALLLPDWRGDETLADALNRNEERTQAAFARFDFEERL